MNAADLSLLDNLIYLHEPVSETPLFNYDLMLKILDIAVEKKAELIINSDLR